MKSEQLVTCERCGTKNLTPRGLKAHLNTKHCRDEAGKRAAARESKLTKALTLGDLDVLPPVKRGGKGEPMPLAEIEEHIRALDAKIEDRTRGYHNEVIYDIVGKGLMLLKANALHNAQGSRTDRKKLRATVAQGFAEGFDAWFAERYPEQSRRTTYNYMNAARNAGLTSDHSLADVEALRTAMALHEKKPTDLYRLPDALKPPASTELPPPINLAAQVQLELFSALDQALTAKESMDGETYEATWQRMQATLQAFTGARWVMSDEPLDDDSAQHGDMHSDGRAPKAAAKSAKKTAKKKGRRS